jgi:predicted peptidase
MLLAAALLVSACGGYTTGDHLLGNHRVDRNRDMPYLIWLPEDFDESTTYPMIVSLHGSLPAENSPESVIRHGLPAVLALDEQPANFDFIVVSPQVLDGVDWWSSGQPEEVNEIVDAVVAELPIDTERIFLTGFGTGGQGAWHLATRYPDRYAAVVSVAGSGFRSSGEVTDASCSLSSVPIWSIHGEDDLIEVHDLTLMEVEAWESLCSAQVKWTTLPGVGHFETLEIAYRDPSIYSWLEEQTTD